MKPVPITEEEARALVSQYQDAFDKATESSSVDGVIDPEVLLSSKVEYVDGDLTLDDLHLSGECPSLLVKGNLTIQRTLKQDFRAGSLYVLGDLRARHIVTTSEMVVTGGLTVQGVLYGNCTNYSTNVLGPVEVGVLVSAKEHYFCFYGDKKAGLIIDVYGDTPNLDDRQYDRESMGEVLLEEIGDIYEENAIHELLLRHDTLLRTRNFNQPSEKG